METSSPIYGKLEPCHYNFAKFEICHPNPHSADDPEYYHYNDIIETSPHCLHEIKCFFEDCKTILIARCMTRRMRKKVVVDAFLPTNTAYDAIQYFQ
uniref:Uncharacterized protein n=1 Tax=Oryza nivara TaxID=4536 RepID=A0A0E0GLH1_ORYNI